MDRSLKYRINIEDFSDDEIFAASEFADGYPYVSLTNHNIVIEGKRKTLIGLAGWLQGYCSKVSGEPFKSSGSKSFGVQSLLDEIKHHLKKIVFVTKRTKES